jgi:hypothetical protein
LQPGDVCCEIAKVPGSDLAQPDVELPIAIGEKGNELAVRRDFRAPFGALPVREAGELGVGEGVLN